MVGGVDIMILRLCLCVGVGRTSWGVKDNFAELCETPMDMCNKKPKKVWENETTNEPMQERCNPSTQNSRKR